MHSQRRADPAAQTDPPEAVQPGRGDLDRLWPTVTRDLRRLAHRQLSSERSGHTLCTTGLVHEVYLRLARQRAVDWSDRQVFFAQASRAMRRILVDYARRHRAMRRGGGARAHSLESLDTTFSDGGPRLQLRTAERAEELLALDEALEEFARLEPRAAQVVECRFFAGYTEDETAEVLGVTARTVARDWVKARAWLSEALRDERAS